MVGSGAAFEDNQFMDVFSINYFKDEYYNETVSEKIERIKKDAKRDTAIINSEAHQLARKKENWRARETAMLLDYEYTMSQPNSNAEMLPKKIKSLATLHALRQNGVNDAEHVAKRIDKKVRKSFTPYNLHVEKTYIAPSGVRSGATSGKTMRLFAISEAQTVKMNRTSSFSSLPVLPPVSVRTRQNESMEKAKEKAKQHASPKHSHHAHKN